MSENTSFPTPPEKKGIPPLGWVGIGCGTLLLIGLIGFVLTAKACNAVVDKVSTELKENPERFTAENIIRMNPELEKVSTNDETGEITFRHKKSGEETTLAYGELKKGKWKVTGPDGSVSEFGQGDLSNTPDWVPLHENLTNGNLLMRQKTASSETGALSFLTTTPLADLSSEFQNTLENQGYETSETFFGGITTVTGKNKENKRTLSFILTPSDNQTQVTITYEEKK